METKDRGVMGPRPWRLLLSMMAEGSRGVRWAIGAYIACGVGSAALALGVVWMTREIVAAACGGETWRLGGMSAIFCALLSGQLVLGKACGRLEAWSITRCSNGLRSRIFSLVVGGRTDGRGELHSADLVSRLTTDVGNISAAVGSVVPSAVVSGVSLLGAFLFLAFLAPEVALVVTLLMPVAILAGKLPAKATQRLTRAIRDEETAIHRLMQEYMGHRVLVATLGYATRAAEEFGRMQSRFFQLTMRRNDLGILAGGAVTLGFMAGYAVMFLYCAYGIADSTVSVATMTALLQLVALVQRPAVELSRKLSPMVRASVSAERLREVESIYGCAPSWGGMERAGEDCGAVRLEHVWFRYTPDGEYALRDFTAEIPVGKVTAICGETGCGKTTVLKLLLGLLTPGRGRITGPYGGRGRYDDMVYVPQGNTLLSGTVRSNLLMGNPAAGEDELRRALYLAAADFVEELPQGLDTPCGERGYGFSEGQAQRVAIARGVLRLMATGAERGAMMLLDEPTSALDADTERTLLERLMPWLEGVTVVIVTHRREVWESAGRCVWLGCGRDS